MAQNKQNSYSQTKKITYNEFTFNIYSLKIQNKK